MRDARGRTALLSPAADYRAAAVRVSLELRRINSPAPDPTHRTRRRNSLGEFCVRFDVCESLKLSALYLGGEGHGR
jgi:hypothetical protein